ncbi:MAG: hypothetical protein V4726_20900 [Verrucomicrobiota bacterium]
MVTLTVPTTFVLDPDTEQKIDRLSRLWNVSTVEAVRRSVSVAEKQVSQAEQQAALEALARLQASATLTEADVAAWDRDRREGWDEAFALLEERRNKRMNQSHDPS